MLLFDRMSRRVAERAGELAGEALERVEAALGQFPDVRLCREGDTLVIEGQGLMQRWVSDLRLRFAWWSSR